MSKARVSRRYPWGTQAPTSRVRDLSAKATAAIAQVEEPGFGEIQSRVTRAVQATFALVQVVDHLGTSGLRVVATKEGPLASSEVVAAAEQVHDAVAALGVSSAVTLGESFQRFAACVVDMIALADKATKRGIEGTGDPAAPDPWSRFGI